MTFAEIKKRQEAMGFGHISTQEFAVAMSRITGDPKEWEAGTGGGLGYGLKTISYNIDRGLEAIGATPAARNIGYLLAGDTGEKAFEILPRGILDFSTAGLGKVGMAAAMGLSGANTYEKTNSPLAGVVSAASVAALPKLSELGSKGALGVGEQLGLNTAKQDALAYTSGKVLSGAEANAAVKANTAVLLRPEQFASRSAALTGFAGSQLGMLAGNVGTQSVIGGIVAPEGQKLNAMAQAFTPESLAVTALSQAPFLAHSVARGVKFEMNNLKAAEITAEANTISKYDAAVKANDARVTSQQPFVDAINQFEDFKASTPKFLLPEHADSTQPNADLQQMKVRFYQENQQQDRMRADTARADTLAAKRGFTTIVPDWHPDTVLQLPWRSSFVTDIHASQIKLNQATRLSDRVGADTRNSIDVSGQTVRFVPGPAMESEVMALTGKPTSTVVLEPAEVTKVLTSPDIAEATKVVVADAVTANGTVNAQSVVAKAVESKGENPTVIAEESARAVIAEADKKTSKQLAAELRNKELYAWVSDKFNATTPESSPALELAKSFALSESKRSNYAESIWRKYKQWHDETIAAGMPENDPTALADLSKSLKQIKSYDKLPKAIDSSREVLKADGTWEAGSRKANFVRPTKEAWNEYIVKNKLDQDPNVSYQVQAYKDTGNFMLVRKQREVTLEANSEKVTEAPVVYSAEEIAASKKLADPVVKASVDQARETLRQDTEWTSLFDEAELTSMGKVSYNDAVGNAELGFKRVKALADEIAAQSGPPALRIRKASAELRSDKYSDLFESPEIADDFMVDFAYGFDGKITNLSDLVAKTPTAAKLMAESVTHPTQSLKGERRLLGELLRKVGLSEAHTAQIAKMLTLFNNHKTLFNSFTNAEDFKALGAFTIDTQGQRNVWLATSKVPEHHLTFALSHELIGHGLMDAHAKGELDARTTKVIGEYGSFLSELTPEQSLVVLREFWSTLPKEFQADATLRSMVESTVGSTEERMANFNAMIALKLTAAPKGIIAETLNYLPKPVADFVLASARYIRRMLETLGAALHFSKFDNADYLTLQKHVDKMYDVLKVDRQQEKLYAEAMRSEAVSSTILSRGIDPVEHNVSAITEQTKFMVGEKRDQASLFQRWIQTFISLGQEDTELRDVTGLSVFRDMKANAMEGDVLKEYSMVLKGSGWKVDKNSATFKVANDKTLYSARDALVLLAQKAEMTVRNLVTAKDPLALASLKGLSAEQQKTVLESIDTFEVVQNKMTNNIKDLRLGTLAEQVAELMVLGDKTLSYKDIIAKVQTAVQDVAAGKPTSLGNTSADALLTKGVARIMSQHTEFTARPYWVTEQRMGPVKARVILKSGKTILLDGMDLAELRTKLKPYEGDPSVQAVKMLANNTTINQDSIASRLIANDAEYQGAMVAELTTHGIAPDVAKSIVERNSLGAQLKLDLAERALPTSMAKRKFAAEREKLDMLQQQVNFVLNMSRALTRNETNAKFNALMSQDKMINHPKRDLLLDGWRVLNTKDPESVRRLGKFGYYGWLAANFYNMIQDAANPLLGQLPGNLIEAGDTIAGSYKRIAAAMLRVKSSNLSADEAAALQSFREGNKGIGAWLDGDNNDVVEAIQARRVAEGLAPASKLHMLSRPIVSFLNHSKGLHKVFTDISSESMLLAGYDFYRNQQKLSHTDAYQAAVLLTKYSGDSAGKASRSVNLWDAGKMRLGSAVLTHMRNFGITAISAMKSHLTRSFRPDLPIAERAAARKALMVSTFSAIAQAGVMGLPGAGVMLIAMEKLFGIKAREAIYSAFDDNDPTTENISGQVAMHGLLNFSGYNISARQGIPGVFGINEYSGFDAEALLGPALSQTGKWVNGVAALIRGDFTESAENLAPNSLRNAIKLYANDGQILSASGTKYIDATDNQKAMYALFGLKPTELAKKEELISLSKVGNKIDQDARNELMQELNSLANRQDMTGLQLRINSAAEKFSEKPQAILKAFLEYRRKKSQVDGSKLPINPETRRNLSFVEPPINQSAQYQSRQFGLAGL